MKINTDKPILPVAGMCARDFSFWQYNKVYVHIHGDLWRGGIK